jgi:hypothetical protein
MQQAPFVPLSQRVDRMKNIVLENIVVVGLRDTRANSENKNED